MSVDMLIGRKEGMTHIFDDAGRQLPVTIVTAGPCPVVQIKTSETDGYFAVQLGFGEKRPKTAKKPVIGHYKKAGLPVRRILRESRLEGPAWVRRVFPPRGRRAGPGGPARPEFRRCAAPGGRNLGAVGGSGVWFFPAMVYDSSDGAAPRCAVPARMANRTVSE